MNIAIIGAPGAGKSTLAQALSGRLSSETRTVTIVDDYVAEIEKEGDIALGPLASYVGNLMVALGRYARERKARAGADDVISVGTMIETAVYFALNTIALEAVSDAERQAEVTPRVDATMRLMACLYTDIMDYDRVLLLPLRSGDEDGKMIDQYLQTAMGGFKLLDVTVLSGPDQVDEALEAVQSEVPSR